MDAELEKFVDGLRHLNLRPDEDPCEIESRLYELMEPMQGLPGAEETVAEIFSFMERFPEADIGSPGPLVHFVERFYPACIDQLVLSVGRCPTRHTLWMVNRILNVEHVPDVRDRLLGLLRSVKDHPKASAGAREAAAFILEHRDRE
ncbi:MAG: hypothetical protein FWD68_18535 [Alphaproteobacteria bacterium]|nr:hypothetical protein [Alphaproteobacteria bacterium]